MLDRKSLGVLALLISIVTTATSASAAPTFLSSSRETFSSVSLTGFGTDGETKTDTTVATLTNWSSMGSIVLDSVSLLAKNTSTTSIGTHVANANVIFDQMDVSSLTGDMNIGAFIPRALQTSETRFTWEVQVNLVQTLNWQFTGSWAGSASGGAVTSLKIGAINNTVDQTTTFSGNFNQSNQTIGGTLSPGAYTFIIDADSQADLSGTTGHAVGSFSITAGQFTTFTTIIPEPALLGVVCPASAVVMMRRRGSSP